MPSFVILALSFHPRLVLCHETALRITLPVVQFHAVCLESSGSVFWVFGASADWIMATKNDNEAMGVTDEPHVLHVLRLSIPTR